ncbi:hypothetical protein [Aureispira sp. CCB-E]|uniref:hypothetical protein n=1 Tax=Aureispira sp. CCB-E TaxID=3051121 RepID=UPI0028683ED2|nr:hypothetical protein [Aureispira sp. CCB-E]WMX17053.1 hypothetical protein QP953_11785 [Aureispira sp. CCB-E]
MENKQPNTTYDLEEELRQQLLEQANNKDLTTDLDEEEELDFETAKDLEQKSTKTASTDSTGTKTDFSEVETAAETAENNSDTLEQLEEGWEEEPIIEIEEDPLDGYVQEPPKTNPVEEIKKATGSSSKNLKNLAELGEIAFTYIDLAKAQLCSSISGQYVAEYTADEKAKKVLIAAVQEYLSTQEIKAPTPLMTLLLAVGTWAAAGFGAAFWHRYQIKQMEPKKETASSEITQEEMVEDNQEQGQPSSDFSHLKEYQDGRKLFSIHKTTGTYKHLPNNTYCAIDVADEVPSPEIQALIDQGKTNPEIRAIIYDE